MTPQQLITVVNQLQLIDNAVTQRQVMIWLLQQLTGNTMTAQQLITAVNQLQVIDNPVTENQVIIYLLQLATGNTSGGASVPVVYGAYGGQPPFTPTVAVEIAIDTANPGGGTRTWVWANGQWQ